MTRDIDIDTDTGPDEIALPGFEERLRHRLAQAHHDHQAVPRSLRSGDLPHRRRAKRSLTIGAGTIAAAAAIVVAIVARQPDGPSGGDAVAGPPTSELAALVIAATDEAEATSVVHITQNNEKELDGDVEYWFDETSGAYRRLILDEDGAPSFDSARQDGVERTVDHCFAEYREGPPTVPADFGSPTGWVQRGLAQGWLVEDGTEVVDGQELIRLRSVMPMGSPGLRDRIREGLPEGGPDSPETVVDGAEDVPPPSGDEGWGEGELELDVTLVDPDTYRPVTHLGSPGSDAGYVHTFEYLPRTPENLAKLEATVPAGFTQVEHGRGDGARSTAGCF